MKKVYSWFWVKNYVPPEVQKKRKHLVNVLSVSQTNPDREGDVTRFRYNDTVLICGDGRKMPEEVREFESWDVPHDVYCVNRSMLFFKRPIDHWCAVDIEEAVWFSEHLTPDMVHNDHSITRHTIGSQSLAFDVYWQMDYDFENDFQRRILTGNSGYFAVLTAIQMGYKKMVLAGIPLDMEPCWYEPLSAEGPNWNGWCYTQWMDFKIKTPENADRVKSLGGYSAFILGDATKEWLYS